MIGDGEVELVDCCSLGVPDMIFDHSGMTDGCRPPHMHSLRS